MVSPLRTPFINIRSAFQNPRLFAGKLCLSLMLMGILFFIGCGAPVKDLKAKSSPAENVVSKNYIIGEEKQKFVGEAIVTVKDYLAVKKTLNKLKPSNDFSISDGKETYFTGIKDEPIDILGTIQADKKTLLLIPSTVFWEGPFRYLLVFTEDAKFTGDIAAERAVTSSIAKRNAVKINPEITTFSFVEEETVNTSAGSGYTNFEIIFMGINNDSINLLYREYTRASSSVPAYYQTFTYPVKSPYIRFKKLKIDIVSVNSEKITYIVKED